MGDEEKRYFKSKFYLGSTSNTPWNNDLFYKANVETEKKNYSRWKMEENMKEFRRREEFKRVRPTVPELDLSSPRTANRNVDFPEPFGPTIPTNSPSSTVRQTSLITTFPDRITDKSQTSSTNPAMTSPESPCHYTGRMYWAVRQGLILELGSKVAIA